MLESMAATARQKKFYTDQRVRAEEAADEGDKSARSQVSQIYGKLGREPRQYTDPESVNKGILGSIGAMAATPEALAGGIATDALGGAVMKGLSKLALPGERAVGQLATRAEGAVARAVTPRVVGKATVDRAPRLGTASADAIKGGSRQTAKGSTRKALANASEPKATTSKALAKGRSGGSSRSEPRTLKGRPVKAAEKPAPKAPAAKSKPIASASGVRKSNQEFEQKMGAEIRKSNAETRAAKPKAVTKPKTLEQERTEFYKQKYGPGTKFHEDAMKARSSRSAAPTAVTKKEIPPRLAAMRDRMKAEKAKKG